MRTSLLFLLLTMFFVGHSQTKQDYIFTYAEIAVKEMEVSKIPASITLAQGILESRFGTSELSTKSNNHFGIKCHKGWNGESVKYDDDAKDECFRKYESAHESFRDHSAFLSKRGRYSDLFKLSIYDYKGWAKGLKKAGYATNPKYADHLIRIIEEEKLYVFDRMSSREVGPYIASLKNKVAPNQTIFVDQPKQQQPEEIIVVSQPITIQGGPASAPEEVVAQSRDIFIENNVKAVFSFSGDNPARLAQMYDIPLKKLYKYNEWPEYLNEFTWGMKVYLQPKKSKSKEITQRYHTVKSGETMYQIAQQYGMVTDDLYKRNRMSAEQKEQPRAGEVLSLRKKSKFKPLLRREGDSFSADQMQQQDQDEAIEITSEEQTTPTEPKLPENKQQKPSEVEEPVITETNQSEEDIWGSYPSTKTEEPKQEQPTQNPQDQTSGRSIIYDPTPPVNQQPVKVYQGRAKDRSDSTPTTTPSTTAPTTSQVQYHTVVKGDTLYGLSLTYKVTVDQIKTWNQLTNNNIKIGQKLIIKQ